MEENEVLNLELDWSLSDVEIDEILGKENSDTEGLSEHFIDEVVDEFVEENENIPPKKKGLFSDVFKKDIKKKKISNQENPEDAEDSSLNLTEELVEYDMSPETFNEILQASFDDVNAGLTQEQVEFYKEDIEAYKNVNQKLSESVAHIDSNEEIASENRLENDENHPELQISTVGDDSTDFSVLDGTSIVSDFENPNMGELEGVNFSESEINDVLGVDSYSQIQNMDNNASAFSFLRNQDEKITIEEKIEVPIEENESSVYVKDILLAEIIKASNGNIPSEIEESLSKLSECDVMNFHHEKLLSTDSNFLSLAGEQTKNLSEEDEKVIERFGQLQINEGILIDELEKKVKDFSVLAKEISCGDSESVANQLNKLINEIQSLQDRVELVSIQKQELSNSIDNVFVRDNISLVSETFASARVQNLTSDDIEMALPTNDSKIAAVKHTTDCFSSHVEETVNNSVLNAVNSPDLINAKLFSQIQNATNSLASPSEFSANVGLMNSPMSDNKPNISVSRAQHDYIKTFNDNEVRKYYGQQANGKSFTSDTEAILNGQRVAFTPDSTQTEEKPGGFIKQDVLKANSTMNSAENGFGTDAVPRFMANATGMASNERTSFTSEIGVDISRQRQARDIMAFNVNHAYVNYSRSVGEAFKQGVTNGDYMADGTAKDGLRELIHGDLAQWTSIMLSGVGSTSALMGLKAQSRLTEEASVVATTLISAGKLKTEDLNVFETQRILSLNASLVHQQEQLNELKSEMAACDDKTRCKELDVLINKKKSEISSTKSEIKKECSDNAKTLDAKLSNVFEEKKNLEKEIQELKKELKALNKSIDKAEITEKVDIEKKIAAKKSLLERKETDMSKLGDISKNMRKNLTSNAQFLYRKLNEQSELLKKSHLFDPAHVNFIKSKAFFGNGDYSTYGAILQRYFKDKGVFYSREHSVASLKPEDVKKLIKNSEKHGFDRADKEKLKDLHAKSERRMLINSKGNRESGGREKLTGRSKSIRIGKKLVDYAASAGDNTAVAYRTIKQGFQKVAVTSRIITVSKDLIKREWSKSLTNKVGTRMINGVRVRIDKKVNDTAIGQKLRQRRELKSQRKVERKSFWDEKRKQAKDVLNDTKRNVKTSFDNTKVVKGFNNKKEQAKVTMNKVSNSVKNSTVGKTASKTAKKVSAKVNSAKTGAAKVVEFITKPSQLLTKAFAFLHQIAGYVLSALGSVLLFLVKVFLIILAFTVVIQGINALINGSGEMAQQGMQDFIEVAESIINYDDVDDMRQDVQDMLDMDEKRIEEARKIGEGKPINPYVTNGMTIDYYGSPDKYEGYTIHFVDAYGNEMPSDSTNARDIESLCMAMFGNQLGAYEGYRKDKKALDALIRDMYELLAGEMTYEESEIYFCNHGCEEYWYSCNCLADYNQFNTYINNGAKMYKQMVPRLPEDDGCKTYKYTEHDWQWEVVGRHWEDTSYYDDWYGEWIDDGYWEDDYDYVDYPYEATEHYCDGNHYVPICFGHKDIDIYIHIYDLEYAIENNIYPKDWKSKPYAKQIEDFIEKGAWENEIWADRAKKFNEGDWYNWYGIDVERGCGFSRGKPLSEQSMNEIKKRQGSKLSDQRKEVVDFALHAVGNVNYQYGGKASGTGFDAKFGSNVADEKGRKNGLDCSGFVAWVYDSALGIDLPKSTAEYAGKTQIKRGQLKVGDIGMMYEPGSKDNHIGIYMGMDESGRETWVHCSSSSGATYGTCNFQYYYSAF